jgi:hypothetical protein
MAWKGQRKHTLIQFFACPGRHAKEEVQLHDYKTPMHRMENGIKMSLAEMIYDILRNPMKKFRQKEEDQKIKERRYHFTTC